MHFLDKNGEAGEIGVQVTFPAPDLGTHGAVAIRALIVA